MLWIALACLAVIIIGMFLMGLRYLTANQFMPYHATVLQTKWDVVDVRYKALILALLRVVGGALLGNAIALTWLCVAMFQGHHWAIWAIFTDVLVTLAPAMYVTKALRLRSPKAKTPFELTVLGMVLNVCALLAYELI